MLGTGLGHTVLVTSWRYTIHWLHTDAAGWAGQSTVVGGHTTPAPGGHRGAWSLVTNTLGHLGAGWPGPHGSLCHHCAPCLQTPHYWPVSSAPVCHCMLVCHRVPGPARTILHTRLTLLTAADTGLRLRPHWLTAPLQLSPLTVQGWARAHQHWWKAASPGLWASVRASHCLTICHAASDWRLAEDLGLWLARGVDTSDLGNWHCWHIPRHRQQPFIKTTLAIWRLPHPVEKEMYNATVL